MQDVVETISDRGGDPGMGPAVLKPVVRSRIVRGLLIGSGVLCVGLGLLGAVLPLLPTTPFLLLAAACFARSSDRLHRWLYTNRFFGDYLRRFQAGEGLPLQAKVSVLVFLWLSLGLSAWAMPERLTWLRPLLLVIGSGATIHILRMKTRRY
jgi:uncharacterized membrane protein YbaN (DUF454 family)